jgi:hypothetical protein
MARTLYVIMRPDGVPFFLLLMKAKPDFQSVSQPVWDRCRVALNRETGEVAFRAAFAGLRILLNGDWRATLSRWNPGMKQTAELKAA